jgi:cell division protein FtsX
MRRVFLIGLFAPLFMMVAWPVPAAAEATKVPMAKLGGTNSDLEVFMEVRAGKARIASVERQIRNSSMVRRFAQVSQRDAYREFRRIFKRNQKLVKSITPSDLPVSFRVDLRKRENSGEFARRMRKLEAVGSVEVRHDPPTEDQLLSTIRECERKRDVDLEVFMRVRATQQQVDAVVAAVAAHPGLSVTRVLSKVDAFAEFEQIFAAQPDIVDSIKPDDLPMSIRVHATGVDPHDVVDELERLDGVDTVVSPSEVCDEILKLLDQGITPELLAKFMAERANGAPS